MNAKQVAEIAKSQLADITGLKPVTVTGTRQDERGWHVSMDVLEMSRIPMATDILGDYYLLLDKDGNLVSFERKRTRLRGEPEESLAKS